MKIAYFLTHPTQNQAPFIRDLQGRGFDLVTVYAGVPARAGFFDPDFRETVSWDVPVLAGYPYESLERDVPVLPPRRGFFWNLSRVLACLDQHRPDLVLLHGWSHAFCRAVWTAAQLRGTPLVLRGETSLESVRGGGLWRRLHRLFYAWRFRSVRAFLSIGSLNQELYRAYGVPETLNCMLPYVVDDTFFATRAAEAAPGREALRQSLGIEPGRPLLLFCGKLLADKGLIPLVRAMGEVARRWDKGRGAAPLLLVAGEGELRGDLESLVAEICPGAVRLLGFRNQTELPALYDLCDLFVLPSLFEPWGLVVNEAMAAGRTVIVSDRVGCRVDLVQEGVNGSVARAGDPSALATAILQWLEKPQALAAAGSASRSILARWRARFEAAPLGELLAVAMQKT